jgi:hypothetical protein
MTKPRKLTDKELREKLRTLPIFLAPRKKLTGAVRRVAHLFVDNCLEFHDFYITDFSSVGDFLPSEKAWKKVVRKAKDLYDVDISKVPNGNIVEIARLIIKETK